MGATKRVAGRKKVKEDIKILGHYDVVTDKR